VKATGTWARTRLLLAMCRWRVQFFFLYRLALRRSKEVSSLRKTIEEIFVHPWAGRVTVEIRPSFGKEDSPERPIYWDAPIAITIERKGRQAIGMALYVLGDAVSIVQLQGVAGIEVPTDIHWPKLLFEACQVWARKENFKEVRLARASSLPSFRRPTVSATEQESGEEAISRVQQKMICRYDETAEQLGLIMGRRWWIWRNLNHTRFSRPRTEQVQIRLLS
jgi:hypothetical protein